VGIVSGIRKSDQACPACGRADALAFPWGFRWWRSRVICAACGIFARPVHVHCWSLPLLLGVNVMGAFFFGTLPVSPQAQLALTLGLALLTVILDLGLPYRLVRAKDSPYPTGAEDAEAWTCADCGTAGPDFLGACWRCEAERPAA
jgi:hypothetical protein